MRFLQVCKDTYSSQYPSVRTVDTSHARQQQKPDQADLIERAPGESDELQVSASALLERPRLSSRCAYPRCRDLASQS